MESGADAPLRPYLSLSKTLEQVRPGGVIAYITSKGTMDKQNPAVRRYIAECAELLGAIRLPNTAFKANAGTEVTSDILFLQKRERPLAVEPAWVHLGQTADGIPVNSYFAAHPEMMLGTMVREPNLYGNENETACIPLEGAVLSEQLTEAVQHIRGEYQAAELPNELEGEAAADTIPADPNVKNYAFTMVDGEVYYRTNSVMVRQKLPLPALERIRGMIDLRQQVNDLIQAQLDNADDAALAPIQARLNQHYDAFTAKYGLINARSNASVFSSDFLPIICSARWKSSMSRADWRARRICSPSGQFASRRPLRTSIQRRKRWPSPLRRKRGLTCPTWRS